MDEFSINTKFFIKPSNSTSSFNIVLLESKLWEFLYTNESFYSLIGVQGNIVLDFVYNIRGSEAIAESYFKIFDSQRKDNQNPETTDLRTLVDFTIPEVSKCPQAVAEIAKIYSAKHRSNEFGDPRGRSLNKYNVSKAVDSLRKRGTGGAPYMID